MAWQYTAAAWEHPGLPPHLKLALLAVAWHADEHGYAWPGQKRLARWCGIGVRQLRTNLQELADQGLLAIEQRPRTTNRYRVLLGPAAGRQWAAGGGGSGLPGGTGSGLPPNYKENYREGLAAPPPQGAIRRLDPDRCGHLPVDEEGYCTACGTWPNERSA